MKNCVEDFDFEAFQATYKDILEFIIDFILIDLGLLARVGLAACPANAVAAVKDACHFVASRPGGAGAVRETCDLIIQAKGLHDTLLQQFL